MKNRKVEEPDRSVPWSQDIDSMRVDYLIWLKARQREQAEEKKLFKITPRDFSMIGFGIAFGMVIMPLVLWGIEMWAYQIRGF